MVYAAMLAIFTFYDGLRHARRLPAIKSKEGPLKDWASGCLSFVIPKVASLNHLSLFCRGGFMVRLYPVRAVVVAVVVIKSADLECSFCELSSAFEISFSCVVVTRCLFRDMGRRVCDLSRRLH